MRKCNIQFKACHDYSSYLLGSLGSCLSWWKSVSFYSCIEFSIKAPGNENVAREHFWALGLFTDANKLKTLSQ